MEGRLPISFSNGNRLNLERMILSKVCVVHGLRLSNEEKRSVQHIIDRAIRSCSLTNDYFSFHKEFDAHFRKGSLHLLQNAVAVLMRGYGYDEAEAFDILKQDILEQEKAMAEAFVTWNSSELTKSENLKKYVVLTILACGGLNYWTAISPRYRVKDLKTTADDRSQLVYCCPHPFRRLESYPPPKMAQRSTMPKLDDGITVVIPDDLVNEAGKANDLPTSMDVYLSPFRKACAEKVCSSPFEYTTSLPGKNTVGKFIDALQTWFTLPGRPLEVIRGVCVKLFNVSLM